MSTLMLFIQKTPSFHTCLYLFTGQTCHIQHDVDVHSIKSMQRLRMFVDTNLGTLCVHVEHFSSRCNINIIILTLLQY